ncbi:MAG: cobaltochelatase subunit CobN [Hyphomicrobiaceae bacterium]
MHVLAAAAGGIDDGSQPVDLGQSPADIVVLSTTDTELALIASAWRGDEDASLRLANLRQLAHNYSVDLYVERTLAHARLVVVSLLGGRSYWPYGIERLAALAREGRFALAVLPGDDRPDASLAGLSTLPDSMLQRLWRCLREGGPENGARFVQTLRALLASTALPGEAEPLAPFIVHRKLTPGRAPAAGRALVVFYRALWQAGDLAAPDALADALVARGLAVTAVAVTSLRDEPVRAAVASHISQTSPDVIVNLTAFAAGGSGAEPDRNTFGCDAVVLQAVLPGQSRPVWRADPRGLSPSDMAMHVTLPEMDGRILTRAIAFKSDGDPDPGIEYAVRRFVPDHERLAFVADAAVAWAGLRRIDAADKRVAIVLANYPNRDSRMANGVGLDTPGSAVALLAALRAAGHAVTGAPATSRDLLEQLGAGPTNAGHVGRAITERLPLAAYHRHLASLPEALRDAVTAQWGAPEDDPFVAEDGTFAIAALRFGNAVVALQPARGYNIDPKATYHDPALVPPHGYLAFYCWLRETFRADAVVHLGKHGNLEWLPGKALALSAECWPDAILGSTPNIYPFIVNDPGEGAQAKRRTSAVIVDHLMPPLVRAEAHGEHARLEALIDEAAAAMASDRRRLEVVTRDIVATAERIGLAADCGFTERDTPEARLAKLDAYLCDLKELQIRGGLHVLGRAPTGRDRIETLSALVRTPRGGDRAEDASLIRALASDLSLGDAFDPLDCEMSAAWHGPRPELPCTPLHSAGPWRTHGDARERLEALAEALISGDEAADAAWHRTRAVLAEIERHIAPSLDRSARREIDAVLAALDGRFVAPGPSGAPSRGRLDVLPTGRNFFSVDARAVPTPAAWELGRRSAELVVTRYLQDNGEWPKAIALSCWGTANMRTGGDDIAQAMALMGVKPVWDWPSGRVTGFEVMPPAALGRPRIDVTLRVSGFFRDAFPTQIALFDSAVRAVARLDESAADNPVRARVMAEAASLADDGFDADAAFRAASFRVFSTPAGGYGAGLQAMMDERVWETERDLAEAFLAWGHHAYGCETDGLAARPALERRLAAIDAILHNQDNREHDILDSDDYYQFAGGLAVAVRVLKGADVPVLMGDHARPERPLIRTLPEEIARVVRARATNPKWIGAMMRHGYKGAFEMAATVDYLFAFAATARAVRDHHFGAIYDAYVGDDAVRAFIADVNPEALADIAAKLAEAIDRGLWTPKRNSLYAHLAGLAAPSPPKEARHA